MQTSESLKQTGQLSCSIAQKWKARIYTHTRAAHTNTIQFLSLEVLPVELGKVHLYSAQKAGDGGHCRLFLSKDWNVVKNQGTKSLPILANTQFWMVSKENPYKTFLLTGTPDLVKRDRL